MAWGSFRGLGNVEHVGSRSRGLFTCSISEALTSPQLINHRALRNGSPVHGALFSYKVRCLGFKVYAAGPQIGGPS